MTSDCVSLMNKLKHTFFLILILVTLSTLSCLDRDSPSYRSNAKASGERETASTEKAVRESEALSGLDQKCRDIPFFRDSKPTVKSLSKDRTTLFYYYDLKVPVQEIHDVVRKYFADRGWLFIREDSGLWEHQIEFEGEGYWIQITSGKFGDSNLATNCRIK